MKDGPSSGTPYGTSRMTPPRRAIAQATEAMTCAFTVEELASVVRRTDESFGATATVYRAVAAMEAAGFIERVGSREGAGLYARCTSQRHAHHHHVVCDRCGRTATTECSVQREVAEAEGSGFVVTRHEVTLYGLCPECARKGGA